MGAHHDEVGRQAGGRRENLSRGIASFDDHVNADTDGLAGLDAGGRLLSCPMLFGVTDTIGWRGESGHRHEDRHADMKGGDARVIQASQRNGLFGGVGGRR